MKLLKTIKNNRQLVTLALGLIGGGVGVGLAYLMRAAGST